MMLTRKPLLWAVAPLLLLAALSGCEDEQDLAPVFTRIEANVECGYAPLDVQFLAIASGGNPVADPTGANDYLEIRWDFGDDSSGNGSVTSHRFRTPDLYEVRVTVTDDDGDSASETLMIEVRADSLVIAAPADTTVVAGMGSFATPTLRASNGAAAATVKPGLSFNEVLVFNQSVIPDGSGRYRPVVEIYNSGDTAIPLQNYILAADLFDTTRQHTFGTGATVQPGEFQLVWMDGTNTNTAEPHTRFDIRGDYTGAPEDWSGSLYLLRAGRVIDEVQLGGQQTDVSVGRLADGGLDGTLNLTAFCDLCGFDTEIGDYSRFQFRWSMDDVRGTRYEGRSPSHLYGLDDVGERTVLLQVFDTQTSVHRSALINVTVTAP